MLNVNFVKCKMLFFCKKYGRKKTNFILKKLINVNNLSFQINVLFFMLKNVLFMLDFKLKNINIKGPDKVLIK